MAFQSVPDTAEIVVNYTANGENFVNVMAAQLIGGYDLADLTSLADIVDAAVVANWRTIQSVDYTYVNTVVRGLEFENDEEVTNNDGTGVGDVAGDSLPGNVTFSVKKGSGKTGRSARGRLYWIGLAASDLDTNENLVKVASVTAIVAGVEAMRVAINTSAFAAVIVSRFNAGVARSPAITFNWTETVAVNNNVDSQRRRLIA